MGSPPPTPKPFDKATTGTEVAAAFGEQIRGRCSMCAPLLCWAPLAFLQYRVA